MSESVSRWLFGATIMVLVIDLVIHHIRLKRERRAFDERMAKMRRGLDAKGGGERP